MIVAELISIFVTLILPIWVSYRIFAFAPASRPKAASWFLAVIGGPIFYGLLALIVFAIFGTNVGSAFADPFFVSLCSLLSATVCAFAIRRPEAEPAVSERVSDFAQD